jgi:hypothetical protein
MRHNLKHALTLLALLGSLGLTASALASSHREAPLITEDPTADSTDVYAFLSPNAPQPGQGAKVTLIANYIPFQAPSGGPNYFKPSDDILYEIKVDNTGDAREDIVFQFRFTTEVATGETFLYNTGNIDSPNSANLNVKQRYTVTRVDIDGDGTRTSTTLASNLLTAPTYVGPRSNGSEQQYATVAAQAVHTLPNNGRAFVGPRDEAFYIDINAIFDLLDISRTALGSNSAIDGTAGYNVTTLALEIPVNQLTADGSEPTLGNNLGGPNAVLGVWTTASRRKHRVLRRHSDPRDFGPWVQISRLGLPLINEVVVPLGFKDQWNRSTPDRDLAEIAGYVVDPELARLLAAVHGLTVPPAPRADMVQVISFLPGLLTSRTDLQPADLLRLNVALPHSGDLGQRNRLGVIGGDNAGFPNGRRPNDDTVDILERVVGGGILAGNQFANLAPNNILQDSVDANDKAFLNTFPFLPTPHNGYDLDELQNLDR